MHFTTMPNLIDLGKVPRPLATLDSFSSVWFLEVVAILEQSYAKFEYAANLGTDNFLAHDYWGLAYFTHAKLLKSNTPAVPIL
jgi:hypothetical protein